MCDSQLEAPSRLKGPATNRTYRIGTDIFGIGCMHFQFILRVPIDIAFQTLAVLSLDVFVKIRRRDL